MNYSHRVFKWVSGFFSQEGISNQEPSKEEKHIDSKESCCNKQEKPRLYLDCNIQYINDTVQPDTILMSKNNPEHANRFHAIEDVEDVVFMLENDKGLLQIE